MNLVKRSLLIITSIIALFISFTMPIYTNANGIPFNIHPILPKNQDSDVTSYISIQADSALNQELEFVVKNYQDSEQMIEINVVNAYTSPNGVVQYTNKELENSDITDEAYKMTNYLTLEGDNQITLKANEEKRIKTKLAVDKLEGILLGGVSFKTVKEGDVLKGENASFQIDNEINMVVGVKIDFGTNKEIAISIDEPFVDPMPAYYAIRLPVSLDAPLLKKLMLDYEVLQDNELLFEGNGEFDFAPMTKSELILAWEHDKIVENKPYVLKGVFKYKGIDKVEKTLEFEKEFIFKNEKKKVF